MMLWSQPDQHDALHNNNNGPKMLIRAADFETAVDTKTRPAPRRAVEGSGAAALQGSGL